MESNVESIEQLINQINLKAHGGENELEEYLGALFGILFTRGGLQSLSGEKIINQIDSIMAAYGVWQKYPREKDTLEKRKSLVHEIHSKLYSVIDLRIDIDTLLHARLEFWPTMAEKPVVDFSQDEKEQLQKTREETPEKLSDILDKFFRAYFDILNKRNIDVIETNKEVEAACKEYKRLEQHSDCLALFVERDSGIASGIQLRMAQGNGNVRSLTNVDEYMKQAAQNAISQVLKILNLNNHFDTDWQIDFPNVYEGPSIALPLSIAALKYLSPKSIKVDLYTGFTGNIDFSSDSIKKVGSIKEKLQGAANFGLRRVFLPKENEQEARQFSMPGLEIIPIESLSEAKSKLIALSTPMIAMEVGSRVEAKIKSFEIKCKNKSLSVTLGKAIPYGKQLIISDYRNEIPVNIFYGQRGLRWFVSSKKEGSLYGLVEQMCIEVFGPINDKADGAKPNFCKWIIKELALRSTIKNQLMDMIGGKEVSEKNCDYRLDLQRNSQSVSVRQFTSGTLTVTGSPLSAQLHRDICRLIELSIDIPLTAAQSPSTTNENKSHDLTKNDNHSSSVAKKAILSHATSWIGTDESGKGDYFGPLVSAGVCVNKKTELELRALGVRDSKKLSDQKIRKIAKQIRAICKGFYTEVPIPPQTYNSLYEQFRKEGKTLNTLLAWAHARAIENILASVPCEYALADQFADERFIISKLQEAGRKIILIQMPKAEQDIAVAAASILARDRFLFYLDKMNIDYHMNFPKGASAEVIRIAKEFLEKHGKDELAKVAKLHFRTTKEVLG